MDNIKVASNTALTSEKNSARASIRIWLRDLFETDLNIRETLESSKPASEAKPHILEMLNGKSINDELLPEVLDELLQELEQYRTRDPGLYLIDSKTGKSVLKLRDGSIYQPPDYIGEDGIKRRSNPILHPGISAPMIMKIHDDAKLTSALETSKFSRALIAIRDPDSIICYTENRLKEMGYEVGSVEGEIEEIEIGREYYDPLQSSNDQFHRHSAFGEILSKKIVNMMGDARKCELCNIVVEKNSKQRWLRVQIKRGNS